MVSNFQRGTQEFLLYNFKGFSAISSTIFFDDFSSYFNYVEFDF